MIRPFTPTEIVHRATHTCKSFLPCQMECPFGGRCRHAHATSARLDNETDRAHMNQFSHEFELLPYRPPPCRFEKTEEGCRIHARVVSGDTRLEARRHMEFFLHAA